jgi:hypothetical protein
MKAKASGGGVPEQRMNADPRVARALGAGDAKSERDLIGIVARGPIRDYEVVTALTRLREADEVREVGTGISGGEAVTYYRLTSEGAARLPGRLRQATISEPREWIRGWAYPGQHAARHAGAGGGMASRSHRLRGGDSGGHPADNGPAYPRGWTRPEAASRRDCLRLSPRRRAAAGAAEAAMPAEKWSFPECHGSMICLVAAVFASALRHTDIGPSPRRGGWPPEI